LVDFEKRGCGDAKMRGYRGGEKTIHTSPSGVDERSNIFEYTAVTRIRAEKSGYPSFFGGGDGEEYPEVILATSFLSSTMPLGGGILGDLLIGSM